MDENKKEVEVTPHKELLTLQLNSFKKQLIDNILDYRRHLTIMAVEPTFQRQNPQTGKFTTIEELVESYRKSALSAREYVKIIEELLKADTEGKLSEAWSDLDSIPVNMSKDDDEKEEAKA